MTQGRQSPKQVITGLTLHRMTGSKDVVRMMSKMGNIRTKNQAWARMVSSNTCISTNLAKGIATHTTIDNNDGRQETATGTGTSHDTNSTIFQPLLPSKSRHSTSGLQLISYLFLERKGQLFFIKKTSTR